MDDDVDMGAPSISTHSEEKVPLPARRRVESTRKKKPKASALAAPLNLSGRKSSGQVFDVEGGGGELEDEQDQLIDDEDDIATLAPTLTSTSGKVPDTTSKKRASTKRKARKEDTEDESGKRRKTDPSLTIAPRKPSGSDLMLSESFDEGTSLNTGTNTPSISIVENEPPASKAAKRKNTPRKTAVRATKGKPSGLKMVIPALPVFAVDDTASVMSEGGVSGTAVSSPVTGNFEKPQLASPEPGQITLSSPATELVEEANLENIPLPVYPLPTKVFLVQAPPKIPTGFTLPFTLDKSGKKVRHWRTANREIRGIAGGRWFARSWVGNKDSEYATSLTRRDPEKSNGSLGLSKQSSSSVSAPLGRGTRKAKRTASANPSASPSRDASVVPPESNAAAIGVSSINATSITTRAMRAPTKMRIQQLPEDPDSSSDAPMDIDPAPVLPSEG